MRFVFFRFISFQDIDIGGFGRAEIDGFKLRPAGVQNFGVADGHFCAAFAPDDNFDPAGDIGGKIINTPPFFLT